MLEEQKSNQRAWWQGWLTDWSICGPSKKDALMAQVVTAAFCLLLALSAATTDSLSAAEASQYSWWRWLFVAMPIIPGLAAIWLWYRFLSKAEELLQQIYTKAAAAGFVSFLIVFTALGILAKFLEIKDAGDAVTLAFCLTLMLFCINLQYQLRKFSA